MKTSTSHHFTSILPNSQPVFSVKKSLIVISVEITDLHISKTSLVVATSRGQRPLSKIENQKSRKATSSLVFFVYPSAKTLPFKLQLKQKWSDYLNISPRQFWSTTISWYHNQFIKLIWSFITREIWCKHFLDSFKSCGQHRRRRHLLRICTQKNYLP